MMRNTTMEQTLMVKQAFDRKLSKHNVTIKRYYAENGCFADKEFQDEVLHQN